MKKFEFDIAPSILGTIFPNYRIKTKLQILNILLETVRYTFSFPTFQVAKPKGKIVLIVDKMSRLFFYSDDKAYSVVFPFTTQEKDSELHFFYQGININSYLISNLIGIIKSDAFMAGNSLDFSESIIDLEHENEDFMFILRELILYEDGYVRFDFDEEGYNAAKDNGFEHRHPLHHFDLFYTSNATFKLGVENKLLIEDFIDILNINTDCKYMRNFK